MIRNVLLSIVLLLAGASLCWGQMRFDHREHVEEFAYGMECATCHLPGAPSIVPDRQVCLDCHDDTVAFETKLGGTKTHGPVWALNHRSEAKLGSGLDCASCHQQDFCLECHKAGFADEQGTFGNNMINVHTSDFHVTHPIAARTNQQLCASCHESSFCMDCHTDFRAGRASGPSHRRFFGLGTGANFEAIHGDMTQADRNRCDQCHTPDSVAHNFSDWSRGHAREARRSLQTCQACHPTGDVCISCHSERQGPSFNPHGNLNSWRDRAGRLRDASGGKTCRQCHDNY